MSSLGLTLFVKGKDMSCISYRFCFLRSCWNLACSWMDISWTWK